MMKQIIKQVIKSFFPSKVKRLGSGFATIKRRNPQMSWSQVIKSGTPILPNRGFSYLDDYARQFSLIVDKIIFATQTFYVYPFDSRVLRMFDRTMICSITVDFDKVLKSDLNDLRRIIEAGHDQEFKNRELKILSSIEILSSRIIRELNSINTERSNILASYFKKMLYRKPSTLDEALQKILFYDALFWQMGHFHIGLGRLDYILYDYYNNDVQKGTLSQSEAKELLKEFVMSLGKDTIAKSLTLIGDTGQYILLGGVDSNGNNVDNELTSIFLELFSEIKIPDPKLILRFNNNTSDKVWEKAVLCIRTGIGSPLLMGEKPIMEKMVNFGYNVNDVWNVGTSACWEPLVIGKSFDQNNPFKSAVAMKPLNSVILSGKTFETFESLLSAYKEEYRKELTSVVCDMSFDCSPLFSLFFDDCLKRQKDFANGGAVYSYHGAQVVSLPNTVNALLNIKKIIYEKKLFTIGDCRRAIENNFEGMDDFYTLLINNEERFGSTNDRVVELTNDLICFTSEVVKELRCNGKPVKVGFSSPKYIEESSHFQASLDGRKYGEPFAVHISPTSSKIDITEVLDFSTKLVYKENCINGNVVDFILPSSYIKQPDKFIGILKNACLKDVFEIQLNVMDKATLIDAKNHPEKYPYLIVRVWGFSAYFNDLPEEFKDNLIRRAEIYEAA